MADKLIIRGKEGEYLLGRPRYFPELTPDEQRSFLIIRSKHLAELEEELYPNADDYPGKRSKTINTFRRWLIIYPLARLLRFTFLYFGIVIYALNSSGSSTEPSFRRITVYVVILSLEMVSQILASYSNKLREKALKLRIEEHEQLREYYLS